MHFATCPSFVLYRPLHTSGLPDNAAVRLVTHPSSNTFPSEQSISLSPLIQPKAYFPFFPSQIFHLSLHQPFHLNISLPFKLSFPFLSLSPFCFPATTDPPPPPHPELSDLAGVTAADVARPQTSASPVPLHLYSADQTNRCNSLKLAVLTAAFMCSWAAWPKSQLNMLQTHEASTGNPSARLEMCVCNKVMF